MLDLQMRPEPRIHVPHGLRRPESIAGFNLTEIGLAMLILGLAMIPVFGLLTGGVVRTDVSLSYENATSIGSSIMNTLLSTAVTFAELEANAPATAGQKHPGPTSQPNLLGDQGTAPDKYFLVGRIRYYTDLWIGFYPAAGAKSVKFRFYQNPTVDFEKDPAYVTKFYSAKVLTDFAFSPYNTGIDANNLLAGAGPGGTPVKAKWAQNEIVQAASDLGVNLNQRHLAKIILQLRWGDQDFQGSGGVRGRQKSISLVTMKARLD